MGSKKNGMKGTLAAFTPSKSSNDVETDGIIFFLYSLLISLDSISENDLPEVV